MQIPLSLITSFLHLEIPVEKVAETLISLGIEVDAIHSPHPPFSRVVVAEVKSVAPHPDAKNLQVAQVFDGKETFSVVCGAPNCKAGIRTPFARIGAILLDKKGGSLQIQKTSIRGVESCGMLCAADELSLYEEGAESRGILELPEEMLLGADCVPLLWDPVLEISLTPNLGHCMSALGIARELSAALQRPLLPQKFELRESKMPLRAAVSVVATPLCARYMGRVIENVKIAPSPFWLQKKLLTAGLRPINNVVDVTNYILLKNGQPLHAFDLNELEGESIQVRLAEKEAPFVGLDGNTWEIPSGTLLISDRNKPLAIAGILGGATSAVSETTTRIFLEGASFDSAVIRKASKKMGLRTDSSLRFEKGVDPMSVEASFEEAAFLIAQLTGGTVAQGRIDWKKSPLSLKEIPFRPEKCNQTLGTRLSEHEMETIFQRLGFESKKETQRWQVATPLYRFDLHEEVDLIEEIARIYGYQNIERPVPKITTPQIPHDPEYLFETKLRNRLVALGLQEVLNCDLISPAGAAMTELKPSQWMKTLHSKSEDVSIVRPSLLPGILQILKSNLDQKNLSLNGFELGRIHFMQEGKPAEFPMAAIFLTGHRRPAHWERKAEESDFFDLKGLIENLLQSLRIAPLGWRDTAHPSFHPGRQVALFSRELCVGCLGELHPALLVKADIKQRVLYAELNAQFLREQALPPPAMNPLSQYPSSERDWTVSLSPKASVSPLLENLQSMRPPLLERIELIDLYKTEEKQNITLRFTYRDATKTVSFEEVEAAHTHLVQEVSNLLAKTESSR